ncbi:unnamed protein product [Pleuronectes platessa]|uniref:Uncharacterized protein n=1 Tax=Pleuronectes platessa TaxID=8262 RepID=A0A9N7TYI5_PLEPL|nr:unnamed protein product [Pleuronectes platessa]
MFSQGTHGRAGSDRRHRKQPCSREGGRTHRGGQWDNKAQSTLRLGHLARKENRTYAIPSSLPEKRKFPHGVKVL